MHRDICELIHLQLHRGADMRSSVHHIVLFAYGNKVNIKYALTYPFKGPGHCYVKCKEESGKISVDELTQYAKMNFRGSTEAYALITSQPFYGSVSVDAKVGGLRVPERDGLVNVVFHLRALAKKKRPTDFLSC
ncbi:hypothetical protein GPALN_004544 [Globodera pallida]|nr:hypothetical protein GPALN_004544 [Globodera pallida]